MSSRKLLGILGCAAACAWPLAAQRPAPTGLPPGLMQEQARTLCLPCHDARIILQQQLDRRGWTKVVDKMIRWGTPVPPEDREPLINYFAQHFGPREAAPTNAALAEAPGVAKVRAACLGCHDAGVIVEQRLNRRDWTRSVDKMVRWGATVRAEDREAILSYLTGKYGPAASATKEEKK